MTQTILQAKVGEVVVRKREFYLFLVPLTFAGVLGLNLLVSKLYGFGDQEWQGAVWWQFIAMVPLQVGFHELFHIIGFLWVGRAPFSTIRIGYEWRLFAPYSGCSIPVEVKAFRMILIFPLIGTGIPMLMLFALFPSTLLAMLLGLAVWSCSVDMWVYLKIFRFDGNLLLKGDPRVELGYQLFSPYVGEVPTGKLGRYGMADEDETKDR